MASHNLLILYWIAMPLITNALTPLVTQVCKQTQDQNFCVGVFDSDPATGGADLKGLAHISLEASSSQAQDTKAYIQGLLGKRPGPALKRVLDHCNINYGGSTYALQQGLASLRTGNYADANNMAVVAWENSNDCQRVINGGPREPTLASFNTRMVKLSDISRVVTGLLHKS